MMRLYKRSVIHTKLNNGRRGIMGGKINRHPIALPVQTQFHDTCHCPMPIRKSIEINVEIAFLAQFQKDCL